MAVQLGQDGSATIAAVAISNLRNITWSAERNEIDITVKGDTSQKFAAGFVSRRLSMDALLDYVTGQKNIIDYLETATPDTTAKTLVVTVSSGKTFTYTNGAVYLGHEIVSPEGEAPVTVRFNFRLIVPAVIAWV